MKRYITLIIVSILTLGIMIFLFYILLRQNTSYITYIKLQVNPNFVIGIDENKNVVFYNALNEDANKYNLGMFQGKKLQDAISIVIDKLGNAKENKDEIHVTIMTKNDDYEQELLKIITDGVNHFDSNYKIVNHEPTNDELEKYSNEVVYNIKASLNDDTLKIIANKIYKEVNCDVLLKINNLNLNKSSSIIDILKEKEELGYFNDYQISSLIIDEYDVKLLERSNYKVIFDNSDKDNGYNYRIVLNLEIEHKNDNVNNIIEVYSFNYELAEDFEKISNLKKYFYTF